MNRTLRDLSAAPTPALPHGGGGVSLANRRVVAELVFQPCSIQQPQHRLPPIRSLPRGGEQLGWGQQTHRTATTAIRQPQYRLPPFRSLPRGGELGWGQQTNRTATTAIRQPQHRLPLFRSLPRGGGSGSHEKGVRLFHGNPGWGQQTNHIPLHQTSNNTIKRQPHP